MSDVVSERRRVPRAVIADTELSVLAFPIPVRLLDISLGGVPFSADVRVERVDRGRGDNGAERYSIGAAFVSLSRNDQRVIERFAVQ